MNRKMRWVSMLAWRQDDVVRRVTERGDRRAKMEEEE